jgi:hypothetical protein
MQYSRWRVTPDLLLLRARLETRLKSAFWDDVTGTHLVCWIDNFQVARMKEQILLRKKLIMPTYYIRYFILLLVGTLTIIFYHVFTARYTQTLLRRPFCETDVLDMKGNVSFHLRSSTTQELETTTKQDEIVWDTPDHYGKYRH